MLPLPPIKPSMTVPSHPVSRGPWGQVLLLHLLATWDGNQQERPSFQLLLSTKVSACRSTRVLTTPFGLDRSPANDDQNR